ncbi:ArsR/SmtB family transcription factor [Streptomyces melanogenes]|uniref:ArsR/SmtB family transcription factor n=1 Tax=Streptomyces melanogenes TaxID=67326 RepID=UPI00167E52FB|nr:winged helix-turn-helix domain-containing protein [Streptomyces melanogenes]GGP82505.1 transcriptional regulator [Streptomyces melanogenes]
MLRIHFTGDDLARTALADEPDAMWEVSISLHRLQRRDTGVVFGPWRAQALPRIPPSLRLLSSLAPAKGYCPDFLTPARGASRAAQIEAFRSTGRETIRADLGEFRRQNPHLRLPSWCARLADGDSETLGRLAHAADTYFDACLNPYWERIRTQVHRDRARRTAVLADGGWEALFRTLHPSARWSHPVLELDYPVDQEMHLHGRGLVLQPSFFCRYNVTSLLDPRLQPVLVHPIDHDPDWALPAPPGAETKALTVLLGATRAQLLDATANGAATTRQLARSAHTTPPNASRHLTALREAALVRSDRHRNTVLHTITPLGIALLNGQQPALPA